MGSSIAARNTAFRFAADPRQVANVRDALDNLFNAINFQGGFEDLDVLAGDYSPGGVDTATIGVGRVLTDNGQRRLVSVAAPIAVDYTVAGDQAGNGTGTGVAFAAPADGVFLALHLILRRDGTTRAAFTNVAAIPEDSVPDFITPGNNTDEIASKLIALLIVRDDGAAGQELGAQYVSNVGPDVRRTTYADPAGAFAGAVGLPQIVLLAATGDNTIAGVPVSNVRRKAILSVEIDPAEVTALGDSAALANQGSPIPVVRADIQTAAEDTPRVTAEVISGITGNVFGVLIEAADAVHVRVNSFDTFMGH